MPADAQARWRIRWWMKFMDQWLAPSSRMFGWKFFVGPNALKSHGEDKLEEAINRIPLPERQVAWRKAVYGLFSEAEMAESGRRIGVGIEMLEAELGKREWLASDQYSLADVNGFNLAYAMPLQPAAPCQRRSDAEHHALVARDLSPSGDARMLETGPHADGQPGRDPRTGLHPAQERSRRHRERSALT